VRRYPKICLIKVNERRYYGNGVGDEVYLLQTIVIQQPTEEVSRWEVEAALEEGGEEDLFLDVLARELFPGCSPPLHLHLRPERPQSTSAWILASVIVDRTHAICGSGMEAPSAAISPLGLMLDLI
jgi:hypothetical protein